MKILVRTMTGIGAGFLLSALFLGLIGLSDFIQFDDIAAVAFVVAFAAFTAAFTAAFAFAAVVAVVAVNITIIVKIYVIVFIVIFALVEFLIAYRIEKEKISKDYWAIYLTIAVMVFGSVFLLRTVVEYNADKGMSRAIGILSEIKAEGDRIVLTVNSEKEGRWIARHLRYWLEGEAKEQKNNSFSECSLPACALEKVWIKVIANDKPLVESITYTLSWNKRSGKLELFFLDRVKEIEW